MPRLSSAQLPAEGAPPGPAQSRAAKDGRDEEGPEQQEQQQEEEDGHALHPLPPSQTAAAGPARPHVRGGSLSQDELVNMALMAASAAQVS